MARTRRFTCGVPRGFAVADDGSRVLFLRSTDGRDPVNALWSLDPNDGTERLVADPADLLGDDPLDVPDEEAARRERTREIAGGIVGFDGLADLSRVCFALSGRVFVADTEEPRTVELPSTGDAVDPRLSPDGASVAYLSGRTLRVTGSGGDRRVIGTASETVSWGAAEFVAAEEMGRTRGHWWAPDSGALLAARVDVSPVSEWWLAAPVDPEAAPQAIRYPAAGTSNADVALAVVDLSGGVVDVDWRRGEFEYLADVSWPQRSSESGFGSKNPTLVVQSRDQKTLAVLIADPATGATDEVHRLVHDTWVDLVPGAPRWWRESLLTVEGQDDARRLCLDGESFSPAGLQVRRVVDVEDEAVLAVTSTDPVDTDVVRVGADGALEVVAGGGGVHDAKSGGGVLVVLSATMQGPMATVLPGGHEVESFGEEPAVAPDPAFHVVGQRDLRTAVLFPAGHDGAALPVLLDPYGGPQAQRVLRTRSVFLVSQWFADQGFAVVVTDGRGTPGRGPAWERAVAGDLAGPVLDDQVEALHALAAADDRLDLGRVAIRGWSFGGYLAALAVLRRPDVFHAAVAGAPVTDWRLYDTHYTERYLGHPDEDPTAYAATDLCAEAANLVRPLLLIHGLADDNVVVAHTLALSRALLEAGRPHRVLPLSGVTHMTPQEEVAENLLLVQLAFLREGLGIGG